MPKSNMHHKAEGHIFKFARMLRKDSTEAEDKLWQKVRGRRLGVKFRRQHPIDNYIVDFICVERKLIIEVDGGIHLDPDVQQKDMERQKLLTFYGYTFLRFKNDDIMHNLSEVLQEIRENI